MRGWRRVNDPADFSYWPPFVGFLRSPVGNLTQELAQLLAASIVQNQASKDRAGASTNAELTSLADLVSAAAAQRTIAPAFNDGLSTLSHTQPTPFFAPLPMAPPPLDLGDDDEPMPIPSTWRQPPAQEDDPRSTTWPFSIAINAASPRPKRSSSARWPSVRGRWS